MNVSANRLSTTSDLRQALRIVEPNSSDRHAGGTAHTDQSSPNLRRVDTDDRAPSPIEHYIARWQFDELKVEFDRALRILTYRMVPNGRPCATVGLMEDIKRMQADIRTCFEEHGDPLDPPVRYLVLASDVPGIFNLGGNLLLFASLITDRDRKSLRDYARLSIDVIHANAMNLNLPLITVSLIQGEALGGGFEAALCSNVIVAERQSRFGLPEILFGLFPGMGAYSFLYRRLGGSAAERLIFSGNILTAEELHKQKVVDILAEEAEGEAAIKAFARATDRRFNAHTALYRVRKRVNSPSYDEMLDIADIWVDTALGMPKADIRKMVRLARAQEKRSERAAR